jgi:hypothetical protein
MIALACSVAKDEGRPIVIVITSVAVLLDVTGKLQPASAFRTAMNIQLIIPY